MTAHASSLAIACADVVRTLRTLFDPYRPELHYMRGPGPKWHASMMVRAERVSGPSPLHTIGFVFSKIAATKLPPSRERFPGECSEAQPSGTRPGIQGNKP